MDEPLGHAGYPPPPAELTGTDPVCGMKVPLGSPYRNSEHGADIVFCSAHCRDRFAAAPFKYLPTAGSADPEPKSPET